MLPRLNFETPSYSMQLSMLVVDMNKSGLLPSIDVFIPAVKQVIQKCCNNINHVPELVVLLDHGLGLLNEETKDALALVTDWSMRTPVLIPRYMHQEKCTCTTCEAIAAFFTSSTRTELHLFELLHGERSHIEKHLEKATTYSLVNTPGRLVQKNVDSLGEDAPAMNCIDCGASVSLLTKWIKGNIKISKEVPGGLERKKYSGEIAQLEQMKQQLQSAPSNISLEKIDSKLGDDDAEQEKSKTKSKKRKAFSAIGGIQCLKCDKVSCCHNEICENPTCNLPYCFDCGEIQNCSNCHKGPRLCNDCCYNGHSYSPGRYGRMCEDCVKEYGSWRGDGGCF